MADFERSVDYAKKEFNIEFRLREKQQETLQHLFEGRDVISVLPTGYGKSVIYQLLPWMFQKKHDQETPMIVLVVSPLTALMEDQVMELRQRGVSTCFLNIHGTSGKYTQAMSDPDEEDEPVYCCKGVTLSHVADGDFNILYLHPEALRNSDLQRIIRSHLYANRVCCVVVDEAHMISEW